MTLKLGVVTCHQINKKVVYQHLGAILKCWLIPKHWSTPREIQFRLEFADITFIFFNPSQDSSIGSISAWYR